MTARASTWLLHFCRLRTVLLRKILCAACPCVVPNAQCLRLAQLVVAVSTCGATRRPQTNGTFYVCPIGGRKAMSGKRFVGCREGLATATGTCQR